MDNEADYVDEQLNEIIKEIREDSKDPVLDHIIQDLPTLCQVQYDLHTHMMYLKEIAIRYGLYDAATHIANTFQGSTDTTSQRLKIMRDLKNSNPT